jgi:hypothetical protein
MRRATSQGFAIHPLLNGLDSNPLDNKDTKFREKD